MGEGRAKEAQSSAAVGTVGKQVVETADDSRRGVKLCEARLRFLHDVDASVRPFGTNLLG